MKRGCPKRQPLKWSDHLLVVRICILVIIKKVIKVVDTVKVIFLIIIGKLFLGVFLVVQIY